jgi:Fe-S-cluster containining protein
VNFAYPAKVRFECDRCGLCCGDTKEKARHILLLEKEAKTISQETSLKISDFCIKILDRFPYTYEIKKTNAGKCIFLHDSQCLIYESRPLVCMFYPFELKFEKDKSEYKFNFTLECPRIDRGKAVRETDFRRMFELAKERFGDSVYL